MPAGYEIFTKFENQKYITTDELKHMVSYVCGNLNTNNSNYKYWYNKYSYSSKAYEVCQWQKERRFRPIAKWGETICDGELVNYFNEHKNCAKGCGNVYYH